MFSKLVPLGLVCVVACGSTAPDKGTVDAAVDSATPEAASDVVVATSPAAPTITKVAPMMGALHVTWMNNEPSCDNVEAERKTATDVYAVVFTVPGQADNKMDSAAKANLDYTYRLRCLKGGVYSDYSNEMSGNPMK